MSARAQSDDLPVKEWRSQSHKPLVFYITGDGGLNQFSLDLCNYISQSGFSVTAMDAKSYFEKKKTPEQSALDISTYLNKHFEKHQNQDLILIGYSFGADVLPFIMNRLPPSLNSKLHTTLLISPSSTTDFEIHWADRLGYSIKRSMNVITEINKIFDKKIITFFGEDESDFAVREIKIKGYSNVVIPGGHHFNGDIEIVAQTLLKYF